VTTPVCLVSIGDHLVRSRVVPEKLSENEQTHGSPVLLRNVVVPQPDPVTAAVFSNAASTVRGAGVVARFARAVVAAMATTQVAAVRRERNDRCCGEPDIE